ncbi:TPA: ATP-binding protein [Vibrio parahaemolyticus]|uniref:AAA family ATPase n=3 Tax=Vibrio parahaemolyticus TaxID=670 RepID=UPI0002FE024B|nr:AAA family ATPase [Vibrio parahaemolyticus]MBY3747978.1 ATP-binding protein [Vibrio parahaemolyticus]MBY3760129.1 ATP-binding protein [Vibrio parahaemolyticus]MBY3765619.1 ATP-binding protein [Vibrio parahaemolyticus]MBY3776386.1 ATP-binding protein [Vibrio parahaemolyticus]MBY3779605.1 ATP-binding protein [Vibrio parahaemolyticus]
MDFIIVPSSSSLPALQRNTVYLYEDDWDDWFEFSTVYAIAYVDSNGEHHKIGSTKIGQTDMVKDQRRPALPNRFSNLDNKFFSLGQDDSYYDELNKLGEEKRSAILSALNDIALSEDSFEIAMKERVTSVSLLRSVSVTSIKGQFRRLANGGARLSAYSFKYNAPKQKADSTEALELTFDVKPESNPPTNIHVLIGRNGVGKTHLINNMISSIIDENAKTSKVGTFTSLDDFLHGELFSNVVSVTFSAFDETEPLPERKDKSSGIQFSYVGLKRVRKSNESPPPPKSPIILKNEFLKSVLACKAGNKIERWKSAIKKLESDPVFMSIDVSAILRFQNEDEFKDIAGRVFKNLSSGHKIVLLTITRLVETIEEKSLVFLDEPEAHLHPPLLSAFIRSLSDLLVNRNAVSIIATHSPVVLQEVPWSCAWRLWRNGRIAKAERLEMESFGENVGTLTREVFGLEHTASGFHSLLNDAAEQYSSYEEALASFGGQLGVEAKGILRTRFN